MTPEEIQRLQELEELEEMAQLRAQLGAPAAAQTTPTQYNPKPIFNNAIGWVDQKDPKLAAAAEAGVDVQKGAPEGVRTGYEGFAINEGQWRDFINQDLSNYYKQAGIEYSEPVRRGPDSGEYEYYDPVAGRWTVLRHSSIGQAAISKSADALTAIGAMAGLAGGPASSVTKEVVGGAAKTAIGSGLTDYIRTQIGNYLGVNKDVTFEEQATSAAKAGAIEGAMDLAGGTAYNIARYAKRSVMGREVFTEQEAQQLLNGIGKYKGLVNDINAKSGTEFTPFLHQLADPNDPAAQIAERFYRDLTSSSDPALRLAVAQARSNQWGAIRSYFAEANKPFDVGIPPTAEGRAQAGAGLALGMQGEIRQRTAQANAQAAATEAQARKMVEGLPNSTKLATMDASNATRQQLFAQSVQSADRVREAYKRFDEYIGYDAAKGQSPFYVEIDDPELVTYINKFGRNTITNQIKGGKPHVGVKGKVKVDISTLNETAKRLDQLYRDRTEAGMDVGYSDRDLLAAHGKVLDKMSNYLRTASGDGTLPPETYASWVNARAEAKRDAHLFKEGFLAEFLAKDKTGRWVINDQDALRTMLAGKDFRAMGQIKSMIEKDPVAMAEMKKALFALYESKATKNGLPSAQLHDKFMEPDQYGEVMNMFFKNEDFKKLDSYKDVAQSLMDAQQKAKTAERLVRQEMLGDKLGITRWAPEKIVKGFFRESIDSTTAARLTALANKYGVRKDVQNGVMNEIQMKIFPAGPSGQIDFAALDNILSKSGANLVPVMGPDYVNNLKKISEMRNLMERIPAGIDDPPSQTRVQMALRGVIRPMSREGNIMNFLRQNRREEIPHMVWEALTNPDELKRMANLTRIAVANSRVAGTGTAVAGEQLRDEDYVK